MKIKLRISLSKLISGYSP